MSSDWGRGQVRQRRLRRERSVWCPWDNGLPGSRDRAELAEGWWAEGWGQSRQLKVMKCGSSRVGEQQVLDGVLSDPMGSSGCKGGAGRKPPEATARALGKSSPPIWT